MTRPFRLTSPTVLESDLQAQVIQYLQVEQRRGRVSWFCRVNGGLATYGRFKVRNYILHVLGKDPMSKGYSDLHGMLSGGKYFALEVKQPGEKATAEQLTFLQAVRDAGGVGAVIFGYEDVASLLFGEVNPECDQRSYSEQQKSHLTAASCASTQTVNPG